MSQAAFSDFLEVVLIILLIYFGLKIFFRYFGPMILRYLVKRFIGKTFEKKFGQFGGVQNPSGAKQQPNSSQKVKKPKKEVGEYIDYEEID